MKVVTLNFTEDIINCIVAIRVKPGRWGRLDDKNYASWVQVERRDDRHGKTRWAVVDAGLCLDRDGDWEEEPLPSSCDDNFQRRFRFETFPEAVQAALKCQIYVYHGAL